MTAPDPAGASAEPFRPTSLTDDRLAELRREARAQVTTFVHPAQLTRVNSFVTGRHDWATAIVGHPFDLRRMTSFELALLDLAAAAEPEPPVRPRQPAPGEEGYQPTDSERAMQALMADMRRDWDRLFEALRNAEIPVYVAYNYAGRHHYEFHVSGAEHIILRAQLDRGELHRPEGAALCETPSRSAHLSFEPYDDLRDAYRIPTCKACLGTAYRLTDLTPSDLLMAGKRGPAAIQRTRKADQ